MKILTKAGEEKLRWQIERDMRKELEEEYKRKKQEFAHNVIFEAVGKLNDLGDESRIVLAVKVETDNQCAIRMILAQMTASVANKLFGEAKKTLLNNLESI